MKKRSFGRTDIKTSEIGLGCWPLGGHLSINGIPTTYGNVSEKMAAKIVKNAIELGINNFDTADSYSLGNCEKRLGKFLKHYRNDVYIFTKAGNVPVYDPQNPFEIDLSENHLVAALDRSLKRLEMDYVDLFQIHKAPNSEKDYQNIENAFNKIKKENKARYCGVSIGKEISKGRELIKRKLVDSIQLYYNLLDFKGVSKFIKFANQNNVAIIAAEPLSQGFLSGKYANFSDINKNDVRRGWGKKEIIKKIQNSKKFNFLQNPKRSLVQASLEFVLTQKEVSTCIMGVKTLNQLRENVKATQPTLTIKDIQKIQKIQKTIS